MAATNDGTEVNDWTEVSDWEEVSSQPKAVPEVSQYDKEMQEMDANAISQFPKTKSIDEVLGKAGNPVADVLKGAAEEAKPYVEAVGEAETRPFKKDANGGPEWLQRVGDVSGRVGSAAFNMVAAPVGALTGATKPAWNSFARFVAESKGIKDLPEEQANKLEGAVEGASELTGMAALTPAELPGAGKAVANFFKKPGAVDRSTPPIFSSQMDDALTGLEDTAYNLTDVAGKQNKVAYELHQAVKSEDEGAVVKAIEEAYAAGIPKDQIRRELEASAKTNKGLDTAYFMKEVDGELAKLPDPISLPVPSNLVDDTLDALDNSVQVALQSGAAPETVQARLVASLEKSGKPKEEIDDIVEQVMRPYKAPEPLTAEQALTVAKNTSDIRSMKGKNLLSAEEALKALSAFGTKLSNKYNNDLAPFYALGRRFSSKNKGEYLSGDNLVGDHRLALITQEREQANKILPGLLGTENGAVKNIEEMLPGGIVVDNFKVKPYHTIQKEARDAGITTDKLNEFRIAANALDDYNNIKTQIASVSDDIVKLKAKARTGSLEDKAKIANELKAKQKELKDLSGKSTYQGYLDQEGNYRALSQDKAKTVFEEFSKTDAGKAYMKDMQAFSQHLIDMRVDAGLLSKESAEALKKSHPFYLSAQRDVEEFADLSQFMSTKGASTGLKSRKIGESDYTGDPVENTMLNLMGTTRAVQRNRERQQMVAYLAEHLDEGAFQAVFRETKADVMKVIENAKLGQNPQGKTLGKVTKATDVTRTPDGTMESTGNFSVFYNGRRVDLTIKDNAMLASMTRPGSYQAIAENPVFNMSYKGFVSAAQVSRNLITTYNPAFSIASMFKESLGYAFTADQKLVGRANLYKPWKTFQTANDLRKDPELYKYLRQNISPGVLYRDYQNTGGADLIKQVQESKNFYGKSTPIRDAIKAPMKKVAHTLEEFAQYSDIASRARYYNDAKAAFLKQGKSAEEAEVLSLAAARRLGTNYQEQGAAKVFNNIKATTPFLKTTINSITKDLAAGRYRKQQMAEAVGVLAGIHFAANQYNKQFVDEDGNQTLYAIDPNIRKANIILKTGAGVNDYVTIPGPFSFYGREAALSAEALDSAFNAMANKVVDTQETFEKELKKDYPNRPLSGDELGTMMFDALVGQVNAASLVPVGLKTVSELSSNKDAFGKEIVPSFLEKVEAKDQVNPGRTSQFAQALGEKLGISPIQADYVITSNLGGLGSLLLDSSDVLTDAMKGKEKPEVNLKNIPGLSRFWGGTSDVKKEGNEQAFSTINNHLKEIDATLNRKEALATNSLGARDEYIRYRQENKELYSLYKNTIEPANVHIASLYKSLNRLQVGQRTPDETTPEREFLGDPELRKKVTRIREEIADIRRNTLKEVEQHKERYGDLWESRLRQTDQTKFLLGAFRDYGPEEASKEAAPESSQVPSTPRTYDENAPSFLQQLKDKGLQIDPIDYQPPGIERQAPDLVNQEEPYKGGFFERNFPNIRNKVVSTFKDGMIAAVIQREGGSKFTDITEDRGGATKFGVTLATLKGVNPKATAEDVKKLTLGQAKAIYSQIYWDDAKVGQMPIGIQDLVFDANVNHGVTNSNRLLQKALASLGADIKVDGKVGNKTLNALNKYDTDELRAAILAQRKDFYDNIIEKDASQKKFQKGWFNRLEALKTKPKQTMET